MSEWKEYKLGELTVDGKGYYGIAAPAVDYDSSKYTYLRITDINDDGTLNKHGLKSVDDANAEKYLLKPNDIVFARTGASVGRSYFYDGSDGDLVYAGFLIKFSLDPNKVNPYMLKLYTHSQDYYDWIKAVDNGATRGNINALTFASMPIVLPSRDEQDKIAGVLSSLDDKIDLLNRENATLEALAETLFRHYFIENPDPTWKEGKLGEVCYYATDKIDANGLDCHSYISTENMLNKKKGVTDASSIPDNVRVTKYVEGDVLFSNIRPYFKKIWFADRNGGCSNDVLCIQAVNKEIESFVYYTLRQDDFFDYVMLGSKGCKMPRGDKQHIMNWPIQLPDKGKLEIFNRQVIPMIQKIKSNQQQIVVLANQRDTLLPCLMCGEVKLTE